MSPAPRSLCPLAMGSSMLRARPFLWSAGPGDLRLPVFAQNPLWGCMWVMRACERLLLGAKGVGG